MTERGGVGFSAKDHHRVSRVTLAYERGELGPQSGSPPPHTPRSREPIRAMLLSDLATHTGDTVDVEAVVTIGAAPEDTVYVVRVLTGRSEDPTAEPLEFRLRSGSDTATISEDDSADDVQLHLESLPDIGSGNVTVFGPGTPLGTVDQPTPWDVRLWFVVLAGSLPTSVTLEKVAPGPDEAMVSVTRTRWVPSVRVETVTAVWPLPDTLFEGTMVFAAMSPVGLVSIVNYECWEQGT